MQPETIDEFLTFVGKIAPDLLSELMEQAALQAWLDLKQQANLEQMVFGFRNFAWEDDELEWEVNTPVKPGVSNRF